MLYKPKVTILSQYAIYFNIYIVVLELNTKPLLSSLNVYLKVWNSKIIFIFLTVVSTILGFIPFMVGFDKESSWFPLAAGSIEGLIMFVVGIWVFLPLLVVKRKELKVNS